MKTKLLCLFFLLTTSLFAQKNSQDSWHSGELTLFSGESFQGLLKYNLENNSVQIQLPTGAIKTYSSHHVESFELVDRYQQMPRSFFALPYQKHQGYETPIFFELLTEGRICLLNRETLVQRNVPVYNYMGFGPMFTTVPVLVDNYYFLIKKESKVIKFTDKKSDLLIIFKDKESKIEEYINTNKVSIDNRADMMKLVDYYNSL